MSNRSASSPCESRRARASHFARAVASSALALQLACAFPAVAADGPGAFGTAPSAPDPVLETMKTELNRATTELGKAEQPPYYLSYTVYDQNFIVLVG